jgi:hypothetical protein
MQTNARWEDEENNPAITPVRVEFTNQDRSVGVRTQAGQDLLRRQLEASGKLDEVLEQACNPVA